LLPFTTSIAASEILNNEPVSFRGDLMLNPQIPGRVSIQNSRILLGRYPINARGDIAWGNQLGKRGQPVANIVAATGGPLPLLDLARLLYPSASSADVDGTFAGQMVIAGPLTALNKSGFLRVYGASLPRLNVWSANGTIVPEDLSVLSHFASALELPIEPQLSALQKSCLSNVQGRITLEKLPISLGKTTIRLSEVHARAAVASWQLTGA